MARSSGGIKIALEQRTGEVKKQMLNRGMPKSILTFPEYILEEKVSTFTSKVENLQEKRITKDKQIESIYSLIENPFLGNYTACFSSSPHDVNAKLLAAYIMMKAVSMQAKPDKLESRFRKRLRDKAFPLWHNLYGGFENTLLTKESSSAYKPSLLIISNVTIDSTNSKMEKLRDIIEAYASVPKIIVAAGSDPLTIFHSRVYSNLNFCAYLGTPLSKKSVVL